MNDETRAYLNSELKLLRSAAIVHQQITMSIICNNNPVIISSSFQTRSLEMSCLKMLTDAIERARIRHETYINSLLLAAVRLHFLTGNVSAGSFIEIRTMADDFQTVYSRMNMELQICWENEI